MTGAYDIKKKKNNFSSLHATTPNFSFSTITLILQTDITLQSPLPFKNQSYMYLHSLSVLSSYTHYWNNPPRSPALPLIHITPSSACNNGGNFHYVSAWLSIITHSTYLTFISCNAPSIKTLKYHSDVAQPWHTSTFISVHSLIPPFNLAHALIPLKKLWTAFKSKDASPWIFNAKGRKRVNVL